MTTESSGDDQILAETACLLWLSQASGWPLLLDNWVSALGEGDTRHWFSLPTQGTLSSALSWSVRLLVFAVRYQQGIYWISRQQASCAALYNHTKTATN